MREVGKVEMPGGRTVCILVSDENQVVLKDSGAGEFHFPPAVAWAIARHLDAADEIVCQRNREKGV